MLTFYPVSFVFISSTVLHVLLLLPIVVYRTFVSVLLLKAQKLLKYSGPLLLLRFLFMKLRTYFHLMRMCKHSLASSINRLYSSLLSLPNWKFKLLKLSLNITFSIFMCFFPFQTSTWSGLCLVCRFSQCLDESWDSTKSTPLPSKSLFTHFLSFSHNIRRHIVYAVEPASLNTQRINKFRQDYKFSYGMLQTVSSPKGKKAN
jgi:hypothetical protein